MPRYNLNDGEMASLIAYLKTLSAEHSPGVDSGSIRFATVVTEEVPQELVKAMLTPIENFVASANAQQVQLEAQQAKLLEIPKTVTYRRVKLSRWVLKGAHDTWRGQLEEYYRKEPVFALIGGISTKEWRPIHEFSEAHKIPGILPSVDLPVISENDQYTLYFSKGLYQEGEAAARYLQAGASSARKTKIVQIVDRSSRGKALSDGFLSLLEHDPGYSITTIHRAPAEPLTPGYLRQVLDREQPDVLALWCDTGSVESLESIPPAPSSAVKVFVSSTALGTSLMTIPEHLRERTFITYPFRLPGDAQKFARFTDPTLSDEAQKIQSRTYSMLRVLTEALRDLKGDFYREYLLDVIGMRPDIESTIYERLTFAPDQRFIARGCYIVQLAKGGKPDLIRKSEWRIL
jgi:hypothetical protein